MHILDRPNGERVICAGGQNGEIFLAFYNKGNMSVDYYLSSEQKII